MTNQDKVVEQLWYTWSFQGIDTIDAGFRIRAVSSGLQDVRSEIVQRLDPYQRYSLPRDVDRSTALYIAPICLALINTGKERILIHKVYTGQDGYGRFGAYFIHLLVNLPEEFSAKDAILLWKSDFWQHSDVTIDKQSTSLDCVSLKKLALMRKEISLSSQSRAQIRKYLPYVIHAYLTKKLLTEKNNIPRQKLYIAASDDNIAHMILGLVQSLPPQLLKDLTFSTYENNLNEATTEIVGTCWYSIPDPEKDPNVEHLLPINYQEKLAINCYTGTSSLLARHPLVFNDPRAQQCAQDAMRYFLDGPKKFKEYQGLFDTACKDPDLTVEKFLDLYEKRVIRAHNPTKADIEAVLTPRTRFDYEESANMLSLQSYQKKLIELALYEPGWWATYRAGVINLSKRSVLMPELGEALSATAQYALSEAVIAARGDAVLIAKAPTLGEVSPNEGVNFKIIVDLMNCAAPPEVDPQVWHSLLQELLPIKNISAFFRKHRDIYARLMLIWSVIKVDNKLIQPLLFSINWAEFGDFLALNLPLDWTETVTKELIYKSSMPDEEIISSLEKKHHPLIKDFLWQLAQEEQKRRWSTAIALFEKMASGKYRKKMELLSILLKSPMGRYEGNEEHLLQMTHMTVDEKVSFLEHSGPQYLPLLPNNRMANTILGMFGELARNETHEMTLRVLFIWLASPSLVPWFEFTPSGENNLATVLKAAHLNANECGIFFQKYGKKFITLYPWSHTLLNLFDRYTQSGGQLRISLLNIWLKCKLDQETLELVLDAAHLNIDEKVTFLQIYGEDYISLYPQSQVLLDFISDFLEWLRGTDLTIFKTNPTSREISGTERFLRFLCKRSLPSFPPWLLHDWYFVGRFVRKPSVLRNEQEKIPQHIGRLLNSQVVLPPTRVQLMKELAVACIADENEVTDMMNTMNSALRPADFLQLLYDIAESTKDGIQHRRHTKTLLVPCIQFAVNFKSVFHQETEQKYFVQTFLDTLLQNADEKTVKWLDTQSWPYDFSDEWQRYISQRSSLAIAPLSWFEQLGFWWERKIAFVKMSVAMKSNRMGKIIRVGTDYMTTLSSYTKEVPDSFWNRLNKALDTFDMYKDRDWQQYEAMLRHKAGTRSPVEKHDYPVDVKPPRFAGVRFWWERRVAFVQMSMALRSGKIGRVVRAATEYMIILDMYDHDVPNEWWRQIDVAFDFFLAWEKANDETDEAREQAIIEASKKLDELVYARQPAPLLTVHEWRRIVVARRYVAEQEAQRIWGMSRQQMLLRLQAALTPGTPQTTQHSLNRALVKKPRSGFFGWFK